MEASLQRRVQRYGWDKAAGFYEDSWQSQLKPAHDKLFELANIQSGEKIIDVACGTGLTSFRALEQTGETGFVFGNDISDKMIEFATRVSAENHLSQIQFGRMDAEELVWNGDPFDVSICALGLMYVPNPALAFKEMFRVLRPGGRCVVAVWGERKSCGWADLFEIVDKRVTSEVCPMFFNLGNEGVLEKYFLATGYSSIVVQKISTSLHYDSDEQACSAAFEGGPVALAYYRFSEEVKRSARSEYLSSIEPFKNANGYDVPGSFVIGMGFK